MSYKRRKSNSLFLCWWCPYKGEKCATKPKSGWGSELFEKLSYLGVDHSGKGIVGRRSHNAIGYKNVNKRTLLLLLNKYLKNSLSQRGLLVGREVWDLVYRKVGWVSIWRVLIERNSLPVDDNIYIYIYIYIYSKLTDFLILRKSVNFLSAFLHW